MSFGSSDSEQITENTTNQTTQNTQTAQQDFEGNALSGIDGNVTINQTGAEAFELGSDALDFGGEALFAVTSTVNRSLDTAAGVSEYALERMQRTTDSALDFGGEALFSNEQVTKGAFDLVADVVKGATNSLATTSQNAIASAVDFTRSDNAETLNTLTKYGFIAVAVIIVGVAFATSRKKS